MKSRADLEQARNASIKLDSSGSRLRYSRQHLEQSRFARAVSANNADHFTRLDLKAHILNGPKEWLCCPPVALQETQRRTGHTSQRIAQTPVRRLLRAQTITLPQILNPDNRFHRFS